MQDDQNPNANPEPVISEATEEPMTAPGADNSTEEITDETPEEGTSEQTASDTEPETASTNDEEEGDETNKALGMMHIEDMINRQMADIEKKRDEVKVLKSSFDDAFKNDAKFREFDDKVKEANRLKTTYKQAMMKDPAIAQANSQFLNGRDELKDMQMALSDYLKEYNRVSGMTQFETQDGQILEIVQTFKLVKK